ncbi:heavy metal-responsive transcriptional regulator [Thermomonas sp.]|uniref:heavy metal-responsive transcriptional regulator n=1 Tax=Thermomonas sp. TaxID=1971895 RepID=UPI0024890B80|nr:heavy metal-responsive transcriptional regulator [Thermomonas sp.]MDI1253323.1 heavy metal-responsive transcriptional regulator [Thermomonas sp.]
MKIGELARRCDVNIDTIRYYERQGLLPEPDRQASGYRRYQIPDIARLQFVRRAKTLGFTLDEIRELLALSDHREEDMGELKAVAEAKLVDVDIRLAEMSRIRDGLHQLIQVCPGHGALAACPILNALSSDKS